MFYALDLFNTSVDIQPIVQNVIAILGAALGVVLIWVGNSFRAYLDKKFALKDSELLDSLQQRWDEAVKKGIAFTETKLGEAAPKKVETGNIFVATAGRYVVEHWPDLTKQVGLSKEQVEETIIRALPSTASVAVDAVVLAKAGGAPAVEPAKPAAK